VTTNEPPSDDYASVDARRESRQYRRKVAPAGAPGITVHTRWSARGNDMAENTAGNRYVRVPEPRAGALPRQKGNGGPGGCAPIIVYDPDGLHFECTSGCPWYKWIFGGSCVHESVVVDGGVGRDCYCDWGVLESFLGRSAPQAGRVALIVAGVLALSSLVRRHG
jgi:hypothetical protein